MCQQWDRRVQRKGPGSDELAIARATHPKSAPLCNHVLRELIDVRMLPCRVVAPAAAAVTLCADVDILLTCEQTYYHSKRSVPQNRARFQWRAGWGSTCTYLRGAAAIRSPARGGPRPAASPSAASSCPSLPGLSLVELLL